MWQRFQRSPLRWIFFDHTSPRIIDHEVHAIQRSACWTGHVLLELVAGLKEDCVFVYRFPRKKAHSTTERPYEDDYTQPAPPTLSWASVAFRSRPVAKWNLLLASI